MTTSWKRILRRAAVVFVVSRILVLLGASIVAAELRHDVNKVDEQRAPATTPDPDYRDKAIPASGLSLAVDVMMSWDGLWYQRIVEHGYPRVVRPHITYDTPDARAAFFPAYPMLVRGVDAVLPGGDVSACLATNLALGALAVYLAGLLARRLYGERVADRTMILMSLFPGAFVFSFAYTEALLLVVAAACLLALLQRRWWIAGLFAAIGTATRPNGLALVAACAVAAFVEIRHRWQWRPLVAVALAPLGFVGFQLWLGRHTGEAAVWFRVQTQAWGEGASFGYTAIERSVKAVLHPWSSGTNTVTVATVVAMVLLLWALRRHPLPAPVVAYVVVVLALMLLPATVTARPRFLFTAFPLLISAAAWLEHRVETRPGSEAWTLTVSACAAGLVWLVALFGVFGVIP